MTELDSVLSSHLRARADRARPLPDLDKVVAGISRTSVSDAGSKEPRRRRLLGAAAAVAVVGLGGLLWIQRMREVPATSEETEQADVPTDRQSGSIEDPLRIDLAPWIDNTLAWPPGQPNAYLIFDIDVLDGWVPLDQTGGHMIGEGTGYHWSQNLNDPEGRQFLISVSSAAAHDAVSAGDGVEDINGVEGTLKDGSVSWPIDEDHTATVIEFGTASTERVVALARELTTTAVDAISTRQPANSAAVRVEQATDGFGGSVDGVRWSASLASGMVRLVLDGIVEESFGISGDVGSIGISESGNNDLCVFVVGLLRHAEPSIQLVLADSTTVQLPSVPYADGQWFTVCIPYALDAVEISVTNLDDSTSFRHQLRSPYLQPTIGQISP